MRVVSVGDVPFAVSDPEEAAGWVVSAAASGRAESVRLSNAYCVALASKDPEYRRLLAGPGVTFPDGLPIQWMMNWALSRGGSADVARRVRGPSLFRRALGIAAERGVRCFFIGATPETLTALTERVRDEYPTLAIAGTYSPPFGPVTPSLVDDWASRIRASGAQLVWVGLGTPKQDFLARDLADKLNLPVVGVGAAFDFVAGTVKEAPPVVQRLGVEWLYRLTREPRRLWRRYLFGNAQFLFVAVRRLTGSVREVRATNGNLK